MTWSQIRTFALGTAIVVIDALIARPLFRWLDRNPPR